MAGGIWSSQNKLRPGAYINFANEANATINIGERGIATMPIALSWGGESSLIEITSEDLLTGKTLAKIGLLYSDPEALLIRLALENCSILKLFNKNSGGTKASVKLFENVIYSLTTDTEIDTEKTYYTRSGEGTSESPYTYTEVSNPIVGDIATYYEANSSSLQVIAKYPGTFGNKIAIIIRNFEDKFTVETYANGYFVDSQNVSNAQSLVANDYVDFVSDNVQLEAISSVLLEGGNNGVESDDYTRIYFNLLLSTTWNTMALPNTDATIQSSVIDFIKNMRDNEGKYVQAVIPNGDVISTNHEGIINNVNGVILNDNTKVSAENFVAWVAGATAGAPLNESLTGRVIENATGIIGALDNSGVIEGLQQGKFILSRNQNGSIKVEKDINSLHTFDIDKSYMFSKNRIIRTLDSIGSGIEDIWETTFLGKVNNNEEGRMLFKSAVIDFLTRLQSDGAVDEFDSETVIVEKGDSVDSVIASLAIRPVDSMEILYMTVSIS